MSEIITIANQKGGVGKTTTSHALSTGLAARGYKVLALDLDPQANLTDWFGKEDAELSISEVFNKVCPIRDAIAPTDEGVDIIPGSIMLAGADRKYSHTGCEYMVKEMLEDIKADYDFIIIDTPPSLGVLNLNALAATDKLIVVLTPDAFALKGLGQLMDSVSTTRKYLQNPTLKVDGLLLTMCDKTVVSSVASSDAEMAAKMLETKIFQSTIRRGVAVRDAQYEGISLLEKAGSGVMSDYNNFIDELLKEV